MSCSGRTTSVRFFFSFVLLSFSKRLWKSQHENCCWTLSCWNVSILVTFSFLCFDGKLSRASVMPVKACHQAKKACHQAKKACHQAKKACHQAKKRLWKVTKIVMTLEMVYDPINAWNSRKRLFYRLNVISGTCATHGTQYSPLFIRRPL